MQLLKQASCGYFQSLKLYKNDAIKAAKELFYGEDVIKQIKEAKSAHEISKIMSKARNGGNI